jgi:hypothetical protein
MTTPAVVYGALERDDQIARWLLCNACLKSIMHQRYLRRCSPVPCMYTGKCPCSCGGITFPQTKLKVQGVLNATLARAQNNHRFASRLQDLISKWHWLARRVASCGQNIHWFSSCSATCHADVPTGRVHHAGAALCRRGCHCADCS